MRKAFILFLLVLIAGVFVSCNLDELFYREESDDAAPAASDEVGDLTIYEGLAEDSKEAVEKIGEIYGMYAPDVGRFINGQELTDTHETADETSKKQAQVNGSAISLRENTISLVGDIYVNNTNLEEALSNTVTSSSATQMETVNTTMSSQTIKVNFEHEYSKMPSLTLTNEKQEQLNYSYIFMMNSNKYVGANLYFSDTPDNQKINILVVGSP